MPTKIQFTPSWPIVRVSILGNSPSDTKIWEYSKQNDLVIVTKDVDFSDRLMIDPNPPHVVHLRFGNLRKKDFHAFLAKVWPRVEELSIDHKLVNAYLDRIEVII